MLNNLFLFIMIEKNVYCQNDFAADKSDVSKIKNRKIDDRKIQVINDTAPEDTVNKISDPPPMISAIESRANIFVTAPFISITIKTTITAIVMMDRINVWPEKILNAPPVFSV